LGKALLGVSFQIMDLNDSAIDMDELLIQIQVDYDPSMEAVSLNITTDVNVHQTILVENYFNGMSSNDIAESQLHNNVIANGEFG
jgi:hypothetical protein